MKIDLHIHSKNSDGLFSVDEIYKEAKKRKIDLISITDHDTISGQRKAIELSKKYNIRYITGVELNITFSNPNICQGRDISLDLLGYGFDINYKPLYEKLQKIANYRVERAEKIMEKINKEFEKEKIDPLTSEDIKKIQESVDGSFGRPHIANYLIKKGIVKDKQEAFDKYLVKCNVAKYPLSIEEAADLVHKARGYTSLAHPNDPHGTSLIKVSKDLDEQTKFIEKYLINFLDGVECWHTRLDQKTTDHYLNFVKGHQLIATGGSDCHQKPILMGNLNIDEFVASQFHKVL